MMKTSGACDSCYRIAKTHTYVHTRITNTPLSSCCNAGATERLDALLSSDEAWKTRYSVEDDADDMKTPCCAESFVTLLLTITER